MSELRVVVTGSRHWTDPEPIYRELAALDGFHKVVIAHGNSRGGGADTLADRAAADLGYERWPYPVDPEKDGRHRGAPLNRNGRMLDNFRPDLVLAFRAPGKSNGTDDCVRKARQRRIPVTICTPGTVIREVGGGPLRRGPRP
jgi:hypothetical protein